MCDHSRSKDKVLLASPVSVIALGTLYIVGLPLEVLLNNFGRLSKPRQLFPCVEPLFSRFFFFFFFFFPRFFSFMLFFSLTILIHV